jgi:hypothetical protein
MRMAMRKRMGAHRSNRKHAPRISMTRFSIFSFPVLGSTLEPDQSSVGICVDDFIVFPLSIDPPQISLLPCGAD